MSLSFEQICNEAVSLPNDAKAVLIEKLLGKKAAFFEESRALSRAARRDEEKIKRALAAVGRFSSDCSDGSVRHDAYLAEAFAETGETNRID